MAGLLGRAATGESRDEVVASRPPSVTTTGRSPTAKAASLHLAASNSSIQPTSFLAFSLGPGGMGELPSRLFRQEA